MFQLIRPLANPLMGGHWKGDTVTSFIRKGEHVIPPYRFFHPL